MVVVGWKIKISCDGCPAITFSSGIGRQDVVLQPATDDIELTDAGISFSISRRGKTTRYECPFDKLGYTAPPTSIAQLQAMKCISVDAPQKHILSFLYEFISGELTEVNPYIVNKQPFDMYVLAERYANCKQIEGVSLKKIREAVLDKCYREG